VAIRALEALLADDGSHERFERRAVVTEERFRILSQILDLTFD
jgi:hypothetical protein